MKTLKGIALFIYLLPIYFILLCLDKSGQGFKKMYKITHEAACALSAYVENLMKNNNL